ncbi:MAG: ribosomal protein S18-alanine N-acetyltransferase [Alphaproteobacteria bacterium]|nr:ribosomal protein S18-alanine N-acetyltransferase [Alphaproteobacteria bacterium]
MLRPIHIDDAHNLAVLHAACFSDGVWSAQQLADSLALNTTFGYAVEQDRNLAGFIVCQMAADQAEILTLCVVPPMQRRGLAQELLRQAILHAQKQGAETLMLEVGADNPVACRFYEIFGFKQQGKRRDYYQRHSGLVDALLYSLTITGADLHTAP